MQVFTLCTLRFKGLFSRSVLYMVLLSGIGIFATALLGGVVIGEIEEVVKDLGLKIISFIAVLFCVVSGAGELQREIQEKSIYPIISKPTSRMEYIMGKALGIFFAVSLLVVLLVFFLWILLVFMGEGIGIPLLKVLILIVGEVLVVSAIITFFSTFSTPYLSAFLTLSIYIIGLFLNDFYTFGMKFGSIIFQKLLLILYYVLPSLQCFHVTRRIVYNVEIGWYEVGLAIIYGIAYASFLLMLASWFFRKRDL
ncbi:MAG: ABC transporter permease subunit [Thermodesulfobacteriota bacterium]|nr:ABC transporter permease subunit [Thermodesulfobacteriota bacterium]